MVGRFAPFPLVVAGAARRRPAVEASGGVAAAARDRGAVTFPWRTLATGFVLWVIPAIAVLRSRAATPLFAEIYRFFTTAALVTFGGAYAILAWVNQQAVDVYGWLTQADTVAGLALAETTPGPLIIVLQFVGFMAGLEPAGRAAAGRGRDDRRDARVLGHVPAVLRLHPRRRALRRETRRPMRGSSAALACMTAAVVGVIGSLAIAFGRNILFPAGLAAPDWNAIAIAAAAFALLQWTRRRRASGSSSAARRPGSPSASSEAAGVLAFAK